MALINIMEFHNLSVDDAKSRAEKLVGEVKKKVASFGSALSWKWNENKDTIVLDATSGLAKGMHGEVVVSPDRIAVNVDLPLFLRGMKDMVEKEINTALHNTFK